MTRARHVTPRHTAVRVAKLRNLVNALIAGDMDRDEIGELLQVGPSGVRKYLADLGDKVVIARRIDSTPTFIGFPLYRLDITAEKAQAYLASLDENAVARAVKEPKSALLVAGRDPSRHFHILADDMRYPVRVSRAPIMRDPMVAALFGAGRHEVRA